MSKRFSLWFLGLLFFAGNCLSASIEEALHNYGNKKFELAFQQFGELAKLGSPIAQFNLGAMYARGEGTPKDYEKSYRFIYLAAKSDQQGADKVKAVIAKKLDQAQILKIEKEADAFFAVLKEKLVPKTVTENGATVKVRKTRVKKGVQPHYPKAMRNKGLSGQSNIAFSIDPHGISRHHKPLVSTREAFKKAALVAARQTQFHPEMIDGKPVSVSEIRYRYHFSMEGMKLDQEKLDDLLAEEKDLANDASSMGQMRYGMTLSTISSMFKADIESNNINLDNPNDWFVKSAQNGNDFAGYYLGANIVLGNQCVYEPDKALFWLERSANNGFIDSQVLLGLELIYGYRLTRDLQRGFELLEKAAVQGSTHAQIELARMYAGHPELPLRDGKKSMRFAAMIEDGYPDELSVYEAKAAAFAAIGKFSKAAQWQKKAWKEARSLDLPTKAIRSTMNAYESKEVPAYLF